MATIHPTAIVSSSANIAEDVQIGPFCIVGKDVTLQSGVKLVSNVHIDGRTTIGKDTEVFHSAVIGTAPQDLKYGGEDTETIIGERCQIREFATINRSSAVEEPTCVGNDCLLMAYSHVAHNCQIGNNVILSNAVNLAGHVIVDDFVIVGGMTPVHQFVHIGAHAFIGGQSRISQDVPPFSKGGGIPYKIVGPNTIGLQRKGFAPEMIRQLKEFYRIIYRSNLNLTQAMQKIKAEFELQGAIEVCYRFIENSSRGIAGKVKE